jgi:hypothetical protein
MIHVWPVIAGPMREDNDNNNDNQTDLIVINTYLPIAPVGNHECSCTCSGLLWVKPENI